MLSLRVFAPRVRLDLNSRDVWLAVGARCALHVTSGSSVNDKILIMRTISVVVSLAERLISIYGSCRSFVIIHFRSVAVVIELKPFQIAPVLMNLPGLAVKTVG